MSEVNTGKSAEKKKGKPGKINIQVNFTPMVDMNMLLITFFMFCTTLNKPQVMNLVMPVKENKTKPEDRTKADASKAITLLLAGNDQVFYYFGKPDEATDASLMKTDYSPEGLRAVLLGLNADVVRQIESLKRQKQLNQLSEADFKAESGMIRQAKDGQVVVIKPADACTYENLVDVLDEMQICSIGLYAIVGLTENDKRLLGRNAEIASPVSGTVTDK